MDLLDAGWVEVFEVFAVFAVSEVFEVPRGFLRCLISWCFLGMLGMLGILCDVGLVLYVLYMPRFGWFGLGLW